jgi:hypothetical protein
MSNQAVGDTNQLPAPAAAGAASQAGGAPKSNGEATMDTQIHSLEELKKKAPKVYEQMMLGIAMQITHEMEKAQARLKKLMRDQQREALR